jgi:hypothetical protein
VLVVLTTRGQGMVLLGCAMLLELLSICIMIIHIFFAFLVAYPLVLLFLFVLVVRLGALLLCSASFCACVYLLRASRKVAMIEEEMSRFLQSAKANRELPEERSRWRG